VAAYAPGYPPSGSQTRDGFGHLGGRTLIRAMLLRCSRLASVAPFPGSAPPGDPGVGRGLSTEGRRRGRLGRRRRRAADDEPGEHRNADEETIGRMGSLGILIGFKLARWAGRESRRFRQSPHPTVDLLPAAVGLPPSMLGRMSDVNPTPEILTGCRLLPTIA